MYTRGEIEATEKPQETKIFSNLNHLYRIHMLERGKNVYFCILQHLRLTWNDITAKFQD